MKYSFNHFGPIVAMVALGLAFIISMSLAALANGPRLGSATDPYLGNLAH